MGAQPVATEVIEWTRYLRSHEVQRVSLEVGYITRRGHDDGVLDDEPKSWRVEHFKGTLTVILGPFFFEVGG